MCPGMNRHGDASACHATCGQAGAGPAERVFRRHSGRVIFRRCFPVLVLAAAVAVSPLPGRAQAAGQGGEMAALRDAESRRAQGDLEGAAALLRGVLETRPASVAALLELEQVARLLGDPALVIEPASRFVEADSGSALGYQVLLRTYTALRRPDDIERTAEAWIRATPDTETPYREIARTWETFGDPGRAVRVLERGRERVGRPDALALERAELYARLGDRNRSLEAWDLALGPEGRGLMVVRRRLATLPDAGAGYMPGIIDRLVAPGSSLGRRRAAIELAIAAGLEDRALDVAQGLAGELPRSERQPFLLDMARRADGARMARLGYWAYSELIAAGGAESRNLALRSRAAELALAVGDTATARETYVELERGAPAGSEERRQAMVVRLEVTAREGRLDEAMRGIETFRSEFPNSPELDGLVAAVAAVALERGEVELARDLVEGASGPRSAMVRAQLALRAGDVTAARAAYTMAAAGLRGEEATRALAMATLLGRLSAPAATLVGRAMEALAQRATEEALALLLEESVELPGGDRSAILDFAAGLADRNQMPVEAESIRRTLIEEHPRAPEAPAALLALGRALLRHPESVAAARDLLERLVLEYPGSALVPQARRELDELRRGDR